MRMVVCKNYSGTLIEYKNKYNQGVIDECHCS